MKFSRLIEKAQELDCDHVVTGHYARIEEENGLYCLKKGKDESKDQSYVLYRITQEQLRFVRFPLGEYRKEEIRQIAGEQGFINAEKRDSQDICFVPDGDYASVVETVMQKKGEPGDFVDEQGKVLGRHKGIIHYTIGQRRGLGISAPYPLYVLRIDPEENRVIVGPDKALYRNVLEAEEFNWISGEPPKGSIRAKAKIRYKHKEAECEIIPKANNTVQIIFDDAQRAITPGQSVVIYDGETVLGGGIIV